MDRNLDRGASVPAVLVDRAVLHAGLASIPGSSSAATTWVVELGGAR